MPRILALWAIPRSTSTAFEKMMSQRGDMTCLHEPFGEAWYFGEDRKTPRPNDVPPIQGLTFNSVWKDIKQQASKGPVFSKDFIHYVKHMWSDDFLAHFQHTFLIRDPEKVLPSMYKHWPDFTLDEVGIVEQRTVFDRICDRLGAPPPVVDSDDLLNDAPGITAAYCQATGIPFIPAALNWETETRDNYSWYNGGSWHDNLANSTGLAPQKRDYVPIDHDPRLRKMYDATLPHYEAMYQHRLQALPDVRSA